MTKSYKQKQFIFSEGDRAEEMYIIKSGEVRIVANVKGKNVVVSRLGKSSFFGEVALLRNARHSATAIAEEDTELAVVTKDMLEQHLSQLPPWLQTVIRSLANRLTETMQRIEHPLKEEIFKKAGKSEKVKTAPAEADNKSAEEGESGPQNESNPET